MDGFSWSMLLAAAGVALVHTALGPDHYLPFVLLARARRWSPSRAVAVAAICGVGHVLSSLLLGVLGLALGLAASRLEQVDSGRGSLAAWGLVAFGLAYGSWGVRRAVRRARGLEPHRHGTAVHLHRGGDREHRHAAPETTRAAEASFWALFAIFVLGPCEPLIPLFVLPASRGRWELALATALVFAVVTVGAMTGLTLLCLAGLSRMRLGRIERWDHALAGGIIAASGLAILFLGV